MNAEDVLGLGRHLWDIPASETVRVMKVSLWFMFPRPSLTETEADACPRGMCLSSTHGQYQNKLYSMLPWNIRCNREGSNDICIRSMHHCLHLSRLPIEYRLSMQPQSEDMGFAIARTLFEAKSLTVHYWRVWDLCRFLYSSTTNFTPLEATNESKEEIENVHAV